MATSVPPLHRNSCIMDVNIFWFYNVLGLSAVHSVSMARRQCFRLITVRGVSVSVWNVKTTKIFLWPTHIFSSRRHIVNVIVIVVLHRSTRPPAVIILETGLWTDPMIWHMLCCWARLNELQMMTHEISIHRRMLVPLESFKRFVRRDRKWHTTCVNIISH